MCTIAFTHCGFHTSPLDCMQLCDEVRKEVPTDEHVLHTLRLVYGRAGRTAEVTAMYQAAAAAATDNPALLEGVFAAHVRYTLYMALCDGCC